MAAILADMLAGTLVAPPPLAAAPFPLLVYAPPETLGMDISF
jgi:hypothetical protein